MVVDRAESENRDARYAMSRSGEAGTKPKEKQMVLSRSERWRWKVGVWGACMVTTMLAGCNDPQFEQKAADIIGLYLNPPALAAVFCVDEKIAIQALDRKDPVLPLSPGRAERHGFEYKRHGALPLYAAFATQTGEIIGKTAERHTSAEFVAFLGEILATPPAGREAHVIADNLSAHKTQKVTEFLVAHTNVHLHYTPTYSSWLNQVELWFGKIERDVIARGVNAIH